MRFTISPVIGTMSAGPLRDAVLPFACAEFSASKKVSSSRRTSSMYTMSSMSSWSPAREKVGEEGKLKYYTRGRKKTHSCNYA